jgi:hypothetical protein
LAAAAEAIGSRGKPAISGGAQLVTFYAHGLEAAAQKERLRKRTYNAAGRSEVPTTRKQKSIRSFFGKTDG